jgi:hypothetical protein
MICSECSGYGYELTMVHYGVLVDGIFLIFR